MNHDTYLAMAFSAFNSSLEPNLLSAWGIEICVLEIAGHDINVIQGCNMESNSNTVTVM
jgi:hypothetical protein